MEYIKQSNLKVKCIANEDDFALFGITIDDLFERSEQGRYFLKKLKELAGAHEEINWTNTAYTLQISVLPEHKVALTFSETIEDYISSLRHSVGLADEKTQEVLEQFIHTLEESEEEKARIMISHFEKNVRKETEKN